MTHVTRRFAALFALTVVGVACGSGEPLAPTTPIAKRQLPQPVVEMVAPTAIAAGEMLTVVGRGFADKALGESRVAFRGVYQTASGRVEQVAFEVSATFKNQGVIEWPFGPNIPFSNYSETGVFRGTVTVTNVGLEGELKTADPFTTQLEVRPSILLRQFRPVSAGCSVGITASTADTPFFLEVEAVGMRDGTAMAPLRFGFTVMKEHFQFEGYLGATFGLDPEQLFPKTGPVTVVNDVANGRIARIGSGVPTDVGIFKGAMNGPGIAGLPSRIDSAFQLTQFKTAPLTNPAADSFQASVIITARDASGLVISRAVPLTVFAAMEVRYDGSKDRVVRSFDAVPVSGCIDGGYIGRNVSYAEVHAESRSRTFKFKASGAANINVAVARLNAEFGIEVDATVTSQDAKNLSIAALVLPHEYGVFYRQTLKLKKVATIVYHGPCGHSQSLGEVEVTDWVWSPDLAKGWDCPPLPRSNLKPGEVFEPE